MTNVKIKNRFMQFIASILRFKTLAIFIFSCVIFINPAVIRPCANDQHPLQSGQTITKTQKQIVNASSESSPNKDVTSQNCTHKGHCCTHFLAHKRQSFTPTTQPSINENMYFVKTHIPRNFISDIFKPPIHSLI